MREKRISQLSIFHTMPRNEVARELEAISRVLDDNPGIYEFVYQDMVRAKRADTGREGMTAEQVLRCAILKQYRNLSYEELAFHLEDSQSFRAFSRLRMGQRPGVSTLQENIKELNSVALQFEHEKTGAELLVMENDDDFKDKKVVKAKTGSVRKSKK